MWEHLQRFWMFDDPRSYGARTIMREAAKGLQINGKEVRVYQFNPSDPNATQKMRADLLQSQPDVLFLANHPARLLLNQLGIKDKICEHFIWLLDDPFMMGAESYAEDDLVLVADPSFAEAAQQRGAQKILFLPVAGPDNPESYFDQKFQHSVVYVGALGNCDGLRKQLSPELLNYFDSIIQKKLEQPQLSFDDLLSLHPYSKTQVIKLSGQLAYYLYAESNREYRKQYIENLIECDFALYGNQQWLHANLQQIEHCFKGPLDPVRDYPNLIQSVLINLNLRSLQGFSVPTQRDFWVPTFGGFMISSPQYGKLNTENLNHPFELQNFPWSPAADSPEDMKHLVEYYLMQNEERKQWTKQARAIIQTKHTFSVRMQQLGYLYNIKN